MHFTSWDRSDKDAPVLLIEDGPESLGRFSADTATVDGQTWALNFDKETGAQATLEGVEVVHAEGNFRTAKAITATVGEQAFTFVAESAHNWIIDDAEGNKVGQFSSGGNGVRQAVLEFEGEAALPTAQVVGLSWIARLILESRLNRSSTSLIGTLVVMSLVAVLAWIF